MAEMVHARTAVSALLIACCTLAGCVTTPPQTADRPSAPVTEPVSAPAASSPVLEATTPAEPAAALIDPAHPDAATAQTGKTIGVAIVGSSTTKAGAEKAAQTARGALGEFETYIVVDRSEHYAGMAPGLWVAFEAHRTFAEAKSKIGEDAGWLQSKGIEPYAKEVTVRCSDRFVLFEDTMQ
ncbi:MAG: hypothetical protein Q7W30_00250 [Coriobacteriia bacterium]|nr:hypothetical protein [Coriobacteriia bacterium]